jgi:hypothetical protein
MLIRAKTMRSFTLRCNDGPIGTVDDFYFDDHFWVVRYLVANTGSWRMGRQVLISPVALRQVSTEAKQVAIDLSMEQLENSPSWESDRPVSRQLEKEYSSYFGWPMYWKGKFMWGYHPYATDEHKNGDHPAQIEKAWDPHLRSASSVGGHHIHAANGDIGHVEDFLIDTETWAIRYFIIDTRNWWPGKHVLVSPKWIARVSWSESKVYVNLSREAIKQSPEYVEGDLLTRDYEAQLHQHYKRPGYWADEPPSAVPPQGMKRDPGTPEKRV